MHTFQPYPIGLLEINPFTKISTEWALVTAGTKGKSNPMTISWGGVGELWGKNVCLIFIRDSRYTKEFMDSCDFFSVSFLNEKYREALNYCGAHSGRDVDKWAAANLTPNYWHGVPFPDESNLVAICSKMAAVPITEDAFTIPDIKQKWYANGDLHTMYVGEIVESLAR